MNNAIAHAMKTQTPFSWVKTQKVQAGVYLTYTQGTWAAARIRLLANRLNNLDARAPLRFKVAITNELRSLGWGA